MKKLLARLDFSYLYALLGEATLALTFVFYITIARVLGPEQYGIFAAAIALAAILSLFIQFGLPTLINREVAAHPDEAPQSTVLFLVLEGLTSLGVLIILLPLALLLGYKDETLIVCYLAVFSEICRAAIMTLRGTIKGLGWFRTESVAVAIERLAVVAIATAVLFQTQSLILVVATVAIVRAVNIIGLLFYLSRQIKIWSSINHQKVINTLKVAYPFALSGVLWILYYQVDVVMLKSLSTGEETGFYSAAYRILEIFSALPRVIFYVIFTRFSRYYTTEPEKLPEQIYKAARLLVGAVLPAIVIAGFLQAWLVQLLYGEEFLASVKPLAILIPSLSIKMFGSLSEEFLVATKHEKKLPFILLGAALTNVAINSVLIPQLGAVGAALATLFSEVILCLIGLWMLRRIGYDYIGKYVSLIAAISLTIAAVPSLILNGLTVSVGIAILVPSSIILLILMQRNRFLARVN
ncbi:MAG: flippase [Lyngbya sp.]|nr:flippase [Lyngbya sp.]